MAINLTSLVEDLKGRARVMPELLQQSLDDGKAAQAHLDLVTGRAKDSVTRLQGESSQLHQRFLNLDSRVDTESKRLVGLLGHASASLHTLATNGDKAVKELEADRLETDGLVTALDQAVDGLAKAVKQGVDQHHGAVTVGLSNLRKAHERLLQSYGHLLKDLSGLNHALTAAGKVTTGAVNHLLGAVQQASQRVSGQSEHFQTQATTASSILEHGMQAVQKDEVVAPIMLRAERYTAGVGTLKKGATYAVLEVDSSVEKHDTEVDHASSSLEGQQKQFVGDANGNTPAATKTLEQQKQELHDAQERLGLNDDGTKRNLLQSAWHNTGGKLVELWDGAWDRWGPQICGGIMLAAGLVGTVALCVTGVALIPVVGWAMCSGTVGLMAMGTIAYNTGQKPSIDSYGVMLGINGGGKAPTTVSLSANAGLISTGPVTIYSSQEPSPAPAHATATPPPQIAKAHDEAEAKDTVVQMPAGVSAQVWDQWQAFEAAHPDIVGVQPVWVVGADGTMQMAPPVTDGGPGGGGPGFTPQGDQVADSLNLSGGPKPPQPKQPTQPPRRVGKGDASTNTQNRGPGGVSETDSESGVTTGDAWKQRDEFKPTKYAEQIAAEQQSADQQYYLTKVSAVLGKRAVDMLISHPNVLKGLVAGSRTAAGMSVPGPQDLIIAVMGALSAGSAM